MKKIPVYAGDKLPKELRLAALDLMQAVTEWLGRNGEVDVRPVEIVGFSTVLLNEVNREITYGLWEDEQKQKRGKK